ncbi:SDR family NAD(P)-dependent oxidoreductase [Polaromonas sp.]|uniref:SDR family NAD(P)-dependent oxidoreductase n=1 Tax=Polaromonas sp. TaxID=1869339 RepID=UPI003262EF19
MSRPLALVAGAGGVLGGSLARQFSGSGYEVVGLRRADCDLADGDAVAQAIAALIERHGPVDTLLYNAGHLAVAPFLELEASALRECLEAGPVGAAHCARAVLPGMLAVGRGNLLFTGATASLRGSARFAAMATGKFALRGLVQSLAREFHPQGIHVAHVVLDGMLRGSVAASRYVAGEAPVMTPDGVAANFLWLAQQAPFAWTQELDLRTAWEKF